MHFLNKLLRFTESWEIFRKPQGKILLDSPTWKKMGSCLELSELSMDIWEMVSLSLIFLMVWYWAVIWSSSWLQQLSSSLPVLALLQLLAVKSWTSLSSDLREIKIRLCKYCQFLVMNSPRVSQIVGDNFSWDRRDPQARHHYNLANLTNF